MIPRDDYLTRGWRHRLLIALVLAVIAPGWQAVLKITLLASVGVLLYLAIRLLG